MGKIERVLNNLINLSEILHEYVLFFYIIISNINASVSPVTARNLIICNISS